MTKIEKTCVYFDKPGSDNTDQVIKTVAERLDEGDIQTVIVASTSGETGAKFAEKLKDKGNIIVVSHEKMNSNFKEMIRKVGGQAADGTHLPLHQEGMDEARDTFYTLGQGFKVAVEAILIATDKGLTKPYEDVIGVGGTGSGSDTAIVARATTKKEMFGRDTKKKLEIREILSMPLKKKWW